MQEEEKTMSSNSTQVEGREVTYEGFELQSDFGFDTSDMFGQLKRKTPLIKPEVRHYFVQRVSYRRRDLSSTQESIFPN